MSELHRTPDKNVNKSGQLCSICGINELPGVFGSVPWCDNCIEEFLAGANGETIHQFVTRKKAEQHDV